MQFLAKRNILINWFFFNQIPESLIENTSKYILLKYQKNITASAGGGAVNYTLDSSLLIIDQEFLNYINANYKYTEVLTIQGDIMEPDIKENSMVFVDKSKKTLTKAGVYILSTIDGLYAKRLVYKNKQYYFRSINEEYVDINVLEFEVIGQVKGVLSKV